MARGTTKVMLIMIVGVAILLGAVFAFKAFVGFKIGQAMKANQQPAITVSSAKVVYQNWPQQIKATGSLDSYKGLNITSEIAGMVRSVNFEDGQVVKKGDLLVELNPDTERASLAVFTAQTELAKSTYARDQAQYVVRAVSKQQLDIDLANVRVGQSQMEQQASLIAKKMIRAPYSGRLGISTITKGDYVNPGDRIVRLQTFDPIEVVFTLPQQHIPKIKMGQAIQITTNVFPNRIFTGKITTLEPIVDVATRNVSLEGLLANPKGELMPGMFADVVTTFGKPLKLLTLPLTAISFNAYGQVVFIIKETGRDKQNHPILKVEQAFVKTGESRGDQISVISGLNSGDIVVTSGQLKLKNGSQVVINNRIKPSENPDPQISNEHV